jgi:hypothetical protein
MLKVFFRWGASSLRGHFVLSVLALALPLLLLGLITNIRAGYPTADLGMLVLLSTLVAIPPPLYIWYRITVPRSRRRAIHAKNGAARDL